MYPTDSFTPLGSELTVRFRVRVIVRVRVRVTMRVRAGVRAREVGLGERIMKELKLKLG